MNVDHPYLIILATVLCGATANTGHAAPPYYFPQSTYAEAGNKEGIGVSFDIDSGSTTQTYDAPLHRAGLPVTLSLTADEAERECDYRISVQGRKYRLIRDTCIWSMRFDKTLELFLFDGGMEHAASENYLDKRFRFAVVTMRQDVVTERQCTIIPGERLGLRKAGIASSDSPGAIVKRIAQRVGSGQLSVKDYSCGPARSVPPIDASRFQARW